MGFFNYVGTANDFNINGGKKPNTSYDHQYLAWSFGDSTQGNVTRFGWVEIGLQVNGYNAGGPLVTIYRYGWDNTGAKPSMPFSPFFHDLLRATGLRDGRRPFGLHYTSLNLLV